MKITHYSLPFVNAPEVRMPVGAQVLGVRAQEGAPVLCALVDPEAPIETRRFCILGTECPAEEAFGVPSVGSFQRGAMVFHVFEEFACVPAQARAVAA